MGREGGVPVFGGCLQKGVVFMKGYSSPFLWGFLSYINKWKCFHCWVSLIQLKSQQDKICQCSPAMVSGQTLPCGVSKCTRNFKNEAIQTWDWWEALILNYSVGPCKINKHLKVKRKIKNTFRKSQEIFPSNLWWSLCGSEWQNPQWAQWGQNLYPEFVPRYLFPIPHSQMLCWTPAGLGLALNNLKVLYLSVLLVLMNTWHGSAKLF